MRSKLLIVLIVIALIVLYSAAYTIDETEQAVITQFGEAVGEPKTEPGLYFKVPIIQQANSFPKNLLEWDGERGQIPTQDKTYLWVDTFARWKIVNPLRFFQTVGDVRSAQSRLDDIIGASVRNFITSYPLIEAVRMTNRELDTFEISGKEIEEQRTLGKIDIGRKSIMKRVQEQAQPKVQEFGIQLVDVKVKRLNYVQQVRRSVYERMIAEREQIAQKFISEGKGRAREIAGNRERDLKQISSEAYREAEEIKGKADAKAIRIYAQAYSRDPEFYSFTKTLDIYQKTMDEDSSLVLSTDSDFLQYFKRLKEQDSVP